MTKARDFAMMVGRSEAINPTRVALLDGDAVTVSDSAAVSSIVGNTGTAVYDSLGALPVAGLTAGQQAFVSANNRLYISNGNGWYNVASVNATPTLATNAAAGTIALTPGTPLVVTLTATDSDNADANLAITLESGGDLFKFATISQDSSVVTITPRTADSATSLGSDGSATLTFKASDGIGVASVVNTFTLSFGINWGTDTITETIVRASNGGTGDYFGHKNCAVNHDGTYVAVGAHYEDTGATNAGSAYIYYYNGSSWAEQQHITRPVNTEAKFGLGSSINGDGDIAVFGGQAGTNTGAAYVYTRSGTTWTYRARLQGNDLSNYDQFAMKGQDLAMSKTGDYIAIGAEEQSTTRGALYVFTGSGASWSQQAKILHSSPANYDQFGQSVDINSDGTYIIAGAQAHDTGGANTGSAFIFTRSGSTWSQQAELQGDDTAAGHRIGRGVAINGDGTYAAAGAIYTTNNYASDGTVYVFTRSGTSWSQQAKISLGAAGAIYNYFGCNVTLNDDGDLLAVASGGHNTAQQGKIHIYSRSGTTWSLVKTLSATGDAGDGSVLAFAGDQISATTMSGNGSVVVGTSAKYNSNQGQAHIYYKA
jgi:hypothetical protein